MLLGSTGLGRFDSFVRGWVFGGWVGFSWRHRSLQDVTEWCYCKG